MQNGHGARVFAPQIWVIWDGVCGVEKRACWGGPSWHTCATTPHKRWPHMWARNVVGTRQRTHVAKAHGREKVVEASRAALNATLGMERESCVKEGWWVGSFYLHGVHRRAGADSSRWLWLWWIIWAQQVEHHEMASPSMTSDEQRRSGCHCS